MVSLTRRALLYGSAGLATGLAGCSGLLGGSAESTSTATDDGSNGSPESESAADPETLQLRVATDRLPIWLGTSNSEDSGRPTAGESYLLSDSIIVDDSTRADRLSVIDTVDREQVESFMEATDFATETIYVEMSPVEECFRLDLCHISWTPTEISTDYTRRIRPYTERCAVDESVIEAHLIRIPEALEADNVTGYSSGIGTGPCDRCRGCAEGEGGANPSPDNESNARIGMTAIDSGGDQR